MSGALRRGAPPLGLEGVTLLGPVQDLKEHLASYDLVLTQFGLTAFEAAWAGCGVILLNPSRYHRELARAAGFPEIGLVKPDRSRLSRYLGSPAAVLSALAAVVPEGNRVPLCLRLGASSRAGSRICPSCGSSARKALYRDPAKSYLPLRRLRPRLYAAILAKAGSIPTRRNTSSRSIAGSTARPTSRTGPR